MTRIALTFLAALALMSSTALAQPVDTGITGSVTDAETGAPLARVVVTIVAGGQGSATTNERGEYSLEVRPGTYTVRLASETHAPKRVKVTVRRAGLLDLDVELERSEEAVEVVAIEAPAETKTEAGSLQVRKKATTLSDSMSAQEMSRTADSSAAGAVKRVVSATVVDGKYVLVRGLGGRYMTTLLNGVTLPSPEPDKQAVPLDLFPTSLLANLTVAKSYSARAPGTFAGGTLMIETNSYPSDFTVKAKVSTSFESGSTSSERQTYRGGGIDFLGFDDGTRDLPGTVPSTGPLRAGAGGLQAADVERIAEDFDNNWELGSSSTPPNLSLGLTVGDTVRFDQRKLGYIATASFGRGLDVRETTSSKVTNSMDGLSYTERLTTVRGEEEATIGGLANVGYQLDRDHELGVFWLYTHTGESQASVAEGLRAMDVQPTRSTHLEWAERSLSFAQVSGRHLSRTLGSLVTRWQTNFAVTGRDEPDTRDLIYTILDDGRERFKNEPGSGERFFSTLSETSLGAGLDLELPSRRLTYRLGAMAQHSERDFSARRFRMNFVGDDIQALFAGPSEIFDADAIGPQFQMIERTLVSDAYDASLFVGGVYGELEVEASDRLRLIGGVRYEISQQELTPGSPFGLGVVTEDDNTKRDDNDVLPAFSAVYALTPAMNLRGAYSYTLARPRFRELAPFLFVDYERRRIVSGNPTLLTTRIHNGDLRWEWFARDTEVYAASLFYKRFINPTEQVVVSSQSGDGRFAHAA
ncbi:MAG TPA: TonB-dependent receptor, partial [Kofleriaceae bacterium]|nr:TonB-dependent receptor [Kofleriaceae bacterium]